MRKAFPVLFLTTLLAACASDAVEWDGATCPYVGTVAIAKTYLSMDGNFQATIDRVRGACAVDGDEIETDMAVTIQAKYFDKQEQTDTSLPFFVAVLDKDNNVLQKQTYNKKVIIAPAGKIADNIIDFSISFEDSSASVAPDAYHIVVGFQLSEDQVESPAQ